MTVKSDHKTGRLTKVILGTVAGIWALRMFKLAFQRSRVGQVLEAVIGDDERTAKLNQAFIDKLPKTSLDFRGRPTEPLNFIFLGEAEQIEAAFRAADWQTAVPVNVANWARLFWAGLRDQSYVDAPITPYYISTSPLDLAFQQETPRHSTRQRHHIRIWQTNFKLAGGNKIWLGMASYDVSLRLVNGLKFPYHHIDPDLDKEREYITKQLLAHGGREKARFNLTPPITGRNNHGDRYATDGQIVVIDLTQLPNEA